MNSWTTTGLDLRPHAPEILASTDDARTIALMIPAGESFSATRTVPRDLCSTAPAHE